MANRDRNPVCGILKRPVPSRKSRKHQRNDAEQDRNDDSDYPVVESSRDDAG